MPRIATERVATGVVNCHTFRNGSDERGISNTVNILRLAIDLNATVALIDCSSPVPTVTPIELHQLTDEALNGF